ncbi:MAG: phytanoyl-CoA dioxygenase family protein [Myxococcales bacterium]|nr:phytanoyl-CoA dioxygenase family protein [Myxococcales bacterium]
MGTDRRATVAVTDDRKQQFDRDGYCILEDAIAPARLEMLREECGFLVDECDRAMATSGEAVRDINHRGKRYFISKRHADRPRLRDFVFSEPMARICRALIGDDVWLFNEQFVVKSAEVGMPFSWHQDSGYLDSGCPHKPYLSLWCALDDVGEENGTVYVLPFSRAGVRSRVDHVRQEGTNDLIGYGGDDEGEPAIVPAGSIVAFSSVTFHRSSANTTDEPRRIFLAQYSAEPITDPRTNEFWALATPFLENGTRVTA